MNTSIKRYFEERAKLQQALADELPATLDTIARITIVSIKEGGKVLFCGNGGSAADSQHLAAELVGRFERERKALPAIALTTDSSILTAVSNDYGFERVFERQVEALGKSGDIFIGISTSGSSKNVLRAMEKAKGMGLTGVLFCGGKKGPIEDFADYTLRIPSERTVLVQEGHMAAGHILCDLVESAFSENSDLT